jgi:hypothetical protein
MKGEKGEQSNREYSSKVLARLTSRNYATYAFVSNELGLVYVDYTAECRNEGGKLVFSKTALLAASILKQGKRNRWSVNHVIHGKLTM